MKKMIESIKDSLKSSKERFKKTIKDAYVQFTGKTTKAINDSHSQLTKTEAKIAFAQEILFTIPLAIIIYLPFSPMAGDALHSTLPAFLAVPMGLIIAVSVIFKLMKKTKKVLINDLKAFSIVFLPLIIALGGLFFHSLPLNILLILVAIGLSAYNSKKYLSGIKLLKDKHIVLEKKIRS